MVTLREPDEQQQKLGANVEGLKETACLLLSYQQTDVNIQEPVSYNHIFGSTIVPISTSELDSSNFYYHCS